MAQSLSSARQRKDQHLALALQFAEEKIGVNSDFQQVRFVPNSFPTVDPSDIDLHVSVGPLALEVPFYINAMTGGSDQAKDINRSFARVARRTGLAMATGSQMVAVRDPSIESTFSVVREENPDGFIFANVSAHARPEQAQRAVDMTEADALQVHLNPAQEVVMPEGEHHFDTLAQNLQKIIDASTVPVLVKEVGFGMGAETIECLKNLGADIIDVSGTGGTNFARIELARRSDTSYSSLVPWGLSTAESLLDALRIKESPVLVASGGIHNPMDIAVCLALGAHAVGISAYFLYQLHAKGEDGLAALIESWKQELRSIISLTGSRCASDMSNAPILIRGSLKEFCDLRGVNASALARRILRRDFS